MKGFVFDLDNTLYDRYGTIGAFLKMGWDKARPYINPAYDYEKALSHICHTEALFVQSGWRPVYEHLVSEHCFHPGNIPSFEQFYDFTFHGFYSVAVNHPYTERVLKKLKEEGYLLAIITNAVDVAYQRNKIKMLGIGHYFDRIVIAGEYSEQMCGDGQNKRYFKPEVPIFHHTAELLQAAPGELYYVGDNAFVDVKGAVDAGYEPVWISSRSPWPFADCPMPQHSFETIEGLLSLI